jgi:hypothetical protein
LIGWILRRQIEGENGFLVLPVGSRDSNNTIGQSTLTGSATFKLILTDCLSRGLGWQGWE